MRKKYNLDEFNEDFRKSYESNNFEKQIFDNVDIKKTSTENENNVKDYKSAIQEPEMAGQNDINIDRSFIEKILTFCCLNI